MAAGDLTTLEAVKAYLNLSAPADDALLDQLIAACSAWIKTYLSRDVLTGSYTQRLDGTGTAGIMVGQWPIQAINSITVDGVAVSPGAVVTDGPRIVRADGGRWARGMANVVVSYTAGYTDAPADIAQACVELVAWRYKERDRIGQASKTAGGQETVAYLTTDTPANVKTLLNQWRKVVPV